jgi:hypothetical protein
MQRRTPPEENIPLIVLKPFTRRAASAPPQTPAAQAAGPNAAHEAWIRGIKEVMHFPEDKVFLAQLQARGVTVLAYDRIYFENPYYDGKEWTTKEFEALGSAGGTEISLIRSQDPQEDASTLYHEGIHALQPDGLSLRAAEYEAWTKEEQWRKAHNIPPAYPEFRKSDGTADKEAIKAHVNNEYLTRLSSLPVERRTRSSGRPTLEMWS